MRFVRTSILALVAFALAAASASAAPTRPFRGAITWVVLLCKFQGADTPPHDPAYYRDMVYTRGTGGLADYFWAASGGSITLDGSVVQGWYTETYTKDQSNARSRGQRYQDCKDAAHAGGYDAPGGSLVAVVTYPDNDLFGMNATGAYLPYNVDVGEFGHESGHGIGLNHSFSDDPSWRDADWAMIGEYDDPWDLMSWANGFGTLTARFGWAPPRLNAYHADRMGWLSRSRILTFGADGTASRRITLAPLGNSAAPGYHLVRIPFDPADPFHYYTVEYHQQTGYDAGIPGDTVLLDEVKLGTGGYASNHMAYLLRSRGGTRAPVQSLNANGVTVAVVSASGTSATVAITSSYPDRCVQGYVWREATPADHVCVAGSVRAQARADNAAAPARRAGGGAFGPDTCRQGFVWRETTPADHVCVEPGVRAQARADGAAPNRKNPARLVYGPNTCKSGFVWREADDRDWVCVPPARRAQVAAENAAGSGHRAGGGAFGPDTCSSGYVWRDAFPGDHVCVQPAIRSTARDDNNHASDRLQDPNA